MDIGAMFGTAVDSAKAGMSDLLKQGANAGLGYLEEQAINVISADKADKERALQQSLTQNLATPSNPNSFGSYLSKVAASPVVKQYGGAVLLGVGGVCVLAYILFGRK